MRLFVVRWPGQVPAEKTTTKSVITAVNLLPAIRAAAVETMASIRGLSFGEVTGCLDG